MTPTDTVSQCLQTIKAIRDTIEKALIGRRVKCKAVGTIEGHDCQIVGVHVDCYTGIALQLVSLEGDTVNFMHPATQWVQATETEFPPTAWEALYADRDANAEIPPGHERSCTCPRIPGTVRNAHDHNFGCPVHL